MPLGVKDQWYSKGANSTRGSKTPFNVYRPAKFTFDKKQAKASPAEARNIEIAPPTGFGMVSAIHAVNQWGRKDPFTPSSKTINTEVQLYTATGDAIKGSSYGIGGEFTLNNTTTTTINNLIEHPSTHYDKGDGTNSIPIESTGDFSNDWWNPTTKTIYDPCPNGYKIPENGTYGNVINTTNPSVIGWDWTANSLGSGYTWRNNSSTSFFPASGRRFHAHGTFWGVGSNGYIWMSTPGNSTQGYSLDFHSSAVYPNLSSSRANSLTVRCIRD